MTTTGGWSIEDRLTYHLQSLGPDEYPESYYRALARERLGLDTDKKEEDE